MLLYGYSDAGLMIHRTIDSYPSQDDYVMHAHEEFELYYFIRGVGKFSVEGTMYTLEPGTLLVMQPAESHKLFIDRSHPYERIAVHFTQSHIEAFDAGRHLLRPFIDRPLGHWNCYRRHEFELAADGERLINHLIFSICPGDVPADEKRLAVLANLPALLYRIGIVYEQKRREDSSGARRDIALTVVEYINSHLYEDLSLDSLSEKLFLSRSQISRVFRRATGTSVLQYAAIKRMLYAKRLILEGIPVAEVSRMCGYGDYSSFYRAYKKKFGVAPTHIVN